jgi:hypothetical protein
MASEEKYLLDTQSKLVHAKYVMMLDESPEWLEGLLMP